MVPRLAMRAREVILNRHKPEDMVRAYEELYEGVAARAAEEVRA